MKIRDVQPGDVYVGKLDHRVTITILKKCQDDWPPHAWKCIFSSWPGTFTSVSDQAIKTDLANDHLVLLVSL